MSQKSHSYVVLLSDGIYAVITDLSKPIVFLAPVDNPAIRPCEPAALVRYFRRLADDLERIATP